MCAEELTNQVLFMRNVPAGDRDIWMTFEAVEDGELGERGRGWREESEGGGRSQLLTAAAAVLQSGPCTPRRRFWNRRCSGATSGSPARPTCWSRRSPGARG